jgi:hypothetical protein
MAAKMLTITLPETLYQRVQRAAELTALSVDEVLINTINATLVAPSDLPPDLTNELAAMHLMNETALWNAAEPSLSPTKQQRLHTLNHSAGERSLSQPEVSEQANLLNAYHYSVLRRAQALAILNQRGHPISQETISLTSNNNDN